MTDVTATSTDSQGVTVSVENIGGIDRCDLTFSPGVTVLSGRNATNRTSLLTAVADVLGGSPATLKTDADRGRVELRIDGETYTRTYDRTDGALSSQGTRYSDERDLVDLFVRVLGDNPARRAVEQGGDLRELLMRPVDTERIQREVRERERERDTVDERLRALEKRRERLPDLERRRADLQADLDDLAAELASLEASIDDYEADRDEAERAEDLLSELESLRDDQRDVAAQVDRHESRLEELRAERATVEDELEGLAVPEAELEALRSERDRVRRQRRELDEAIADLSRIVEFNAALLEGDAADLPGVGDEEAVTASLDPSSRTVECWTCGSEVERGAIADRLDELRTLVDERRAERSELEARVDDLTDRVEELQRERDRVTRLEDRLADLDEETEVREEKLATLEQRREDLDAEVADLEARVEETEELRDSDLVEMYQRRSELEYERGRVETELADVESEIEEAESAADERERLAERREELTAEVASLRSRIDDLEREAVEQFNEHVAGVLETLEYGNVARVWIERKVDGDSAGDSTFDLHVVRESTEGAAYEDTVDTLSESEREVVGLVVALAGYLVHDVSEKVPFVLLDSLEAIDAERIERLVDYVSEHAPYLLVALLPEDAAALPDDYDRVTATDLSPS